MQTTNSTAAQVQQLLQWNEGQHNEFIYNCALAYLMHYIKDESDVIISHVTGSRLFWKWWLSNWQARDKVCLEHNHVPLSTAKWQAIYEALHDPLTLAAEMYPSGVVLGESYNTMINQLNKEALCEA